MALETTTPRSRRAILAAALGAGAATIASALGRPLAVRATQGNPVLAGLYNTAGAATELDTGQTGLSALWGNSDLGNGVVGTSISNHGVSGSSTSAIGVLGGSTSGSGVHGDSSTGSGVQGVSTWGNGVRGDSEFFNGVYGSSTGGAASGVYGENLKTGWGVAGRSNSPALVGGAGTASVMGDNTADGIGVWGKSLNGTAIQGNANAAAASGVAGINAGGGRGVLGSSAGGSTGVQGSSGPTVPAAPPKTGVFGYAAQDATSRGVTGQTTLGYGVSGIATTGHGINGTATTGIGAIGYATTGTGAYGYATTTGVGARGYSVSGTGGYFSTSGAKVGTALRVLGKVKLDNCAGVATIASGANSVVVTPGIDLLATSAVVATLQGNPSGTVTVRSVAVDATLDTFTIYLTANATAAVTVAWHVFG